MGRINLYKTGKRLENKLKALSSAEISEENKRLIFGFYEHCVATGLSQTRILKYLWSLERLALWLKKDFPKATKQDIIKLVSGIERMDYADWTKQNYKVVVKRFYKWLKGNDETYPDEVRWISTNMKNNRHRLPEELLTEEEIKRLVSVADNARDKAFVQILYDSGCRIGEVLTLQIKHLAFDEYGAVLLVSGKTGDRRVRLIASAPSLAAWLDSHPDRDNPDAPLWVTLSRNRKYRPFSYATARLLLNRLAGRAHVNKRINPHSFRHARATSLANSLTEAQMKEYFGWTQGSEMAAIYVHLSGRDVDSALLKMHGLKDNNGKKEDSFKVRECPRCSTKNSPASKFCNRCGAALDMKTVLEVEEKRKRADNLMSTLLDDPEIKNLMMQKLSDMHAFS